MLRGATYPCVVGRASNTAMSTATGAVGRADFKRRGDGLRRAGACPRTGGSGRCFAGEEE